MLWSSSVKIALISIMLNIVWPMWVSAPIFFVVGMSPEVVDDWLLQLE